MCTKKYYKEIMYITLFQILIKYFRTKFLKSQCIFLLINVLLLAFKFVSINIWMFKEQGSGRKKAISHLGTSQFIHMVEPCG